MRKERSGKVGFIFFIIFIILLIIGGEYLYYYVTNPKKDSNINNNTKDYRIDKTKDYFYFTNEKVISETAEIYYKDVVINYYVPAQGKCVQTLRANKDFKRLESIVENVGKAINSNIIYPRETFLCSQCLAQDLCKAWTGNHGGEDNE